MAKCVEYVKWERLQIKTACGNRVIKQNWQSLDQPMSVSFLKANFNNKQQMIFLRPVQKLAPTRARKSMRLSIRADEKDGGCSFYHKVSPGNYITCIVLKTNGFEV